MRIGIITVILEKIIVEATASAAMAREITTTEVLTTAGEITSVATAREILTTEIMTTEILTTAGEITSAVTGREVLTTAGEMASAAMAREIMTTTGEMANAATITGETASAVMGREVTVSAVMAKEVLITTEMITSVRVEDPDRDSVGVTMIADVTTEEALAVKTLARVAALCRKVRLRMPRSTETRKSAGSARRRIRETARI